MGLLVSFLRAYVRSGLRGGGRLSRTLASRLNSLHSVPVQVATNQVLYVDLRETWALDMLCNSPHEGKPVWEHDEQDVMARVIRPGEVAFDIGAHFGEHSVFMVDLVGSEGKLYAFEANPERMRNLKRTLAHAPQAEVVNLALSNTQGAQVLFVPDMHSMASLANWTQGEGGSVHEVNCEQDTLDRLVETGRARRPDFIKCDVEGAEHLVFEGAIRTLDRSDAPIILYEANDAASKAFGVDISHSTQMLRGLTNACYSIFWVRPEGQLEPVSELRPDVKLFNLLAVPAAKLDRV